MAGYEGKKRSRIHIKIYKSKKRNMISRKMLGKDGFIHMRQITQNPDDNIINNREVRDRCVGHY